MSGSSVVDLRRIRESAVSGTAGWAGDGPAASDLFAEKGRAMACDGLQPAVDGVSAAVNGDAPPVRPGRCSESSRDPMGSNAHTLETGGDRASNGSRGRTVLIVEDNEPNMKFFNDLLQTFGYNTLQTQDGMEVLKIAREHQPALILMDIQLGEVTGLDVAMWIKNEDDLRDIPIVAVTAYATKSDEKLILQSGFTMWLPKPVNTFTLIETVEHFIN